VILSISLHEYSVGESFDVFRVPALDIGDILATDDCDEFTDVVYGLVSRVRKRRLKLVLEGETIKSR